LARFALLDPAMTFPVAIQDTPTMCPHDPPHHPSTPDPGDLPFSAQWDGDSLSIAVAADFAASTRLLSDEGHRWLDEHPTCSIRVDLSAVTHLSSPLAAWLGRLSASGRPVALCGVNRRVLVQLNLLGLGKILTIEDEA
jgi:anti-anti-sigma regulatory factor